MKRTLQTVLVMSFAAMFLISPVAAATSEGLEWGVALNDEFTFHYKIVEEGNTILDEGVNVTVDANPPTIYDPLTDWTMLSGVDISIVYTNGSLLGFETLYLLGLLLAGGHFVVPIGNFSLLSDLLMGSLFWNENSTIINDGSVWGVRTTGSDDEMTMQVNVHYLKADGFLSRYTLEALNTTNGIRSSVSLLRQGLGLDIIGFIQDNILLVGIGVGVIVILGAVVCIRRR
ncbi:MAG: hypothetical protein ACFFBL_08790 [Promethearchaeota archaeon]